MEHPSSIGEPDITSTGHSLYAFDFDHTIVKDNSDTFVTSAIKTPIPKEIKKIYDGTNWTEYMNKIFMFMTSEGATVEIIRKHIQELELIPGMGQLLGRINQAKTETPGSRFIIVSDANDFFIKTVLDKLEPPVVPHLVITNTARFPNSETNSETGTSGYEDITCLEVLPYENQAVCPICPKNLCKGEALYKYMMGPEGPFDKVHYCGDGRNDVCPALRLRESDTLFVRKGFALEKCILKGSIYEIEFRIRAKIVYFEDGFQIEKEMFV